MLDVTLKFILMKNFIISVVLVLILLTVFWLLNNTTKTVQNTSIQVTKTTQLGTVYVAIGGNDTNSGSFKRPVCTIKKGLELVKDNGRIIIYDDISSVFLFGSECDSIVIQLRGSAIQYISCN